MNLAVLDSSHHPRAKTAIADDVLNVNGLAVGSIDDIYFTALSAVITTEIITAALVGHQFALGLVFDDCWLNIGG